jgi:hypothetical protein
MSDTPYSDAWRERARERMECLGADPFAVGCRTGLFDIATDALDGGVVSLEIAGPIDELLTKLEDVREAEALAESLDGATVSHPGVGMPRVRRVRVDLGPLADCDVRLHGPAVAKPVKPRPDQGAYVIGDERRTWRRP